MTRTVTLVILGAVLLVGITATAVLLISGGYFRNADANNPTATPIPVVEVTSTATSDPALITPTAVPTGTAITPTVTVAPTATATAIPATTIPGVCTDAVAFVADITIPDGSQIAPGTPFVKTWRLRNSGTCTWDGRYGLVFAGGNTLGAAANSFPLAATVAPGELIDVSVNLVAPTSPAAYQSDWKLRNPQGQPFGLGQNRSTPFWVKIVVGSSGSQPNGSIGGFAWQDKDLDNTVEPGELLPNVTITLSAGAECRTVLGIAKTDANGRFTFANLAPNTYCLSGTDGATTVSLANLVLAANQQMTDVNVTWPPVRPQPTTISGLVYQDLNQNGMYDSGEVLMGSREVWLISGTACQVQQNPTAVTFSGADGRYTLAGEFNGSYCVGLKGSNGLDDALGITVTAGQALGSINLKYPVPSGSISGFLWDDYCLTNENGDALDGSCVADGNGDYHADGMIEPTEGYISGVTILLQLGSCTNNNNVQVSAVTDATGKYFFGDLQPDIYCVSMNAAEGGNAALLLPGDWTFPARGIWYQEIDLRQGGQAYPVNFGWDFQLR